MDIWKRAYLPAALYLFNSFNACRHRHHSWQVERAIQNACACVEMHTRALRWLSTFSHCIYSTEIHPFIVIMIIDMNEFVSCCSSE